MRRLPFVLMRGGTSKCVVLEDSDLPADAGERDQILLRAFGSPDARQIDGVGGATSATSKALIIHDPGTADWDVAYTFAQVGIDQARVDYAGNCGNCVSAVGPYAVRSGRVAAVEPLTQVRIRNTNTDSTIVAEVLVEGGRPKTEGECVIPGVPGSGAPIKLWFEDPGGSVTGDLLPTGEVVDVLDVGGDRLEITVVDAGNLVAFVSAESVGATGRESIAEIDGDAALLGRLEDIRGAVAARLGLVQTADEAKIESPAIPKIAFVGKPDAGEPADDPVPLPMRLLTGGRAHESFAITVGIAAATAARLPGSVVEQHQLTSSEETAVYIAHPAGVMGFDTEIDRVGAEGALRRVAAYRTARPLAEGHLLL